MNFARHQHQAERTARRLLWLFAFATLAVVLAVNAVAALAWQWLFGAAQTPFGFHATNTAVVLGLTLGGAWIETSRLHDDGAWIARRLGAVPVDPRADPMQRRLQNLLEELAIAARVAVPRAFVLEDEPSINALTAGMDRNQAVVMVTRGALARLTRDELQGVLAHEVSHIVNGDVRLNTRLVGLNHGLEMVATMGRAMLARAVGPLRGRSVTGPLAVLAIVPLVLLGSSLAVVGAIGEWAARAIRAGVGRQREFFADAQAVEFTRSRDGLGGALRKVAGQEQPAGLLRHPYAPVVGHLLLVGAEQRRRWMATHPPLRDRLYRLYGRHVGPLAPTAPLPGEQREPDLPLLAFAPDGAGGGMDAIGFAPAGGSPDQISRAAGGPAGAGAADSSGWASTRLVQATREPAAAAALVMALIEEPGAGSPPWGEGWAVSAHRMPALQQAVQALPPEVLRALRWPLMELAVARLRPLSRPARESLLVTARALVAADGRITLREWICFGLLRIRLAPPRRGPRLPVLADPIDARSIRLLFALVAQGAHVSEARAERAANAAIRLLDLAPIGGSAGTLSLEGLEDAVARAAALPPLARPLLVRQLVALLPPEADAEVRDFLRLLCVAIDCPPPQLPPIARARVPYQGAGQPSSSHAAA